MELTVSHVGICVSDLERSRRFYVETLGFEEQFSHRVGTEFERLMEVDRLDVRSLLWNRALAAAGPYPTLSDFPAPTNCPKRVRLRGHIRIGLTGAPATRWGIGIAAKLGRDAKRAD